MLFYVNSTRLQQFIQKSEAGMCELLKRVKNTIDYNSKNRKKEIRKFDIYWKGFSIEKKNSV